MMCMVHWNIDGCLRAKKKRRFGRFQNMQVVSTWTMDGTQVSVYHKKRSKGQPTAKKPWSSNQPSERQLEWAKRFEANCFLFTKISLLGPTVSPCLSSNQKHISPPKKKKIKKKSVTSNKNQDLKMKAKVKNKLQIQFKRNETNKRQRYLDECRESLRWGRKETPLPMFSCRRSVGWQVLRRAGLRWSADGGAGLKLKGWCGCELRVQSPEVITLWFRGARGFWECSWCRVGYMCA